MAERSYDEESLKRLSNHKILTREEEQSLLERISRGEKEASDSLVEHNLKFVIVYARRLARAVGKPDIILDIVNAGALQLYQASKGYNVEVAKARNNGEPVKFLTYAGRFVKRKMRREASLLKRIVVPKNSNDYESYRAAVSSLKREGIEVTLKNLEGRVEMSGEILEAFFEFDRKGQASLDQPIGLEGEGRLADITPDSNSSEQIDFLEVEKLRKVLKSLNPSDRRVLELRYLSEKPRTQEGVAEELGLSKQRVSKIELKALEKLKFRMSRPIEGLNLSLSKISKKRRAYRTWKNIDLQEYYRKNYPGMNQIELYRQDKSFYLQLRKRGLLDEVVGREETNQSSG